MSPSTPFATVARRPVPFERVRVAGEPG